MIDLNKLITNAVREKNPLKANLYRMVKSKVEKELQAKNRKDRTMTAEDVTKAIKKEYKEVLEEMKFTNPTNSSMYKALCAKLSYLDSLMPRLVPMDEALDFIKEGMRRSSTAMNVNPKMQDVMKYLKSTGKNFDMKAVSAKVKEMLK